METKRTGPSLSKQACTLFPLNTHTRTCTRGYNRVCGFLIRKGIASHESHQLLLLHIDESTCHANVAAARVAAAQRELVEFFALAQPLLVEVVTHDGWIWFFVAVVFNDGARNGTQSTADEQGQDNGTDDDEPWQ